LRADHSMPQNNQNYSELLHTQQVIRDSNLQALSKIFMQNPLILPLNKALNTIPVATKERCEFELEAVLIPEYQKPDLRLKKISQNGQGYLLRECIFIKIWVLEIQF